MKKNTFQWINNNFSYVKVKPRALHMRPILTHTRENRGNSVITNSIAVSERACFQHDASRNRLTQVFMWANHRIDGHKTTPTVDRDYDLYHDLLVYKQHGATGIFRECPTRIVILVEINLCFTFNISAFRNNTDKKSNVKIKCMNILSLFKLLKVDR